MLGVILALAPALNLALAVYPPCELNLFLGSGGNYRTPIARKAELRAGLDKILGDATEVLVIPYAGSPSRYNATLTNMRQAQIFGSRRLVGIHTVENPVAAVLDAQAIYVNGGNTFRLLRHLKEKGLIDVIRFRVSRGAPYAGLSAGAGVAGMEITVSNDMAITVVPGGHGALALVPFLINPHYFAGSFYLREGSRFAKHGGETRDDRLGEYHDIEPGEFVEDAVIWPVAALPEATALVIQDGKVIYESHEGLPAKLLVPGSDVTEIAPGADLTSWASQNQR